ncbi:hypothetical protein HDU91_001250 [Kappamyces sp. JEL0680]|nr:hypothetical protein HDU91_001250 [Kappamyces sp. JEL0680]
MPSKQKLQLRVGTSVETLRKIEANNEHDPVYVESPQWQGYLVVRIRNFKHGTSDCAAYFKDKMRNFSLQFSGRWLQEHRADDVVFGAVFDAPISPPFGTSIGLRIANLIDPSLRADLYCSKPWLLSPLVCAMNVLNVQYADPLDPRYATKPVQPSSVSGASVSPEKPAQGDARESPTVASVTDAVKQLSPTKPKERWAFGKWVWSDGLLLQEDTRLLCPKPLSSSARRSYFKHEKALAATVVSPDHVYNGEFFGPTIDFNTMKLSLGIHIDIQRYINKQPIRFVAKSRSTGLVFFVFEFDLVPEAAILASGKLDPDTIQVLAKHAAEAKERSYSPYSQFRVGAALLTRTGKIFLGCNVENASYGGAICAERTAFVKAVSEGEKKFIAVAVTTDKEASVGPCGFCRQFMVEFGKSLVVIQATASLKTEQFLLSDLLPHSFGPEDLE